MQHADLQGNLCSKGPPSSLMSDMQDNSASIHAYANASAGDARVYAHMKCMGGYPTCRCRTGRRGRAWCPAGRAR